MGNSASGKRFFPANQHPTNQRDIDLALTILGLSGALTHDPSAALYIDGKLVAAAEEERFVRDKHAKNRMPYEAAKFCLQFAGIKPSDVDTVAIPFAPISLFEKARWHYAKRYWYAPDRSLDAILTGNRRFQRYRKRIEWCLVQLGFDLKKIEIVPVEHHLAHASSAYHCSGFKEKTAILGIDGKTIENSGELPAAVASKLPGEAVRLHVWRGGQTRDINITVGRFGDEKVASSAPQPTDQGRLGVAVRPLTAQEQRLAEVKGGLLVEQSGGAAGRAGIRPGDIIIAVNGRPIDDIEQLRNIIAKSGKKAAILIERGESRLFVPVDLG